VAAADTDIFILLLYAFSKVGPAEKSYMKLDKERCVAISKVCKSYGKVICDVLPYYHSITGCDTTSYPYVEVYSPLRQSQQIIQTNERTNNMKINRY